MKAGVVSGFDRLQPTPLRYCRRTHRKGTEMELGLGGKSALVVGAGADVGRATAISLAREGARVILVGRRREALEGTARLVEAAGGQAQVLPGDARDSADVKRVVAEAQAAAGRIDLMVNTVGPYPYPENYPDVPEPMYGNDASWAEIFDNVFMPAVRLSREVIPLMKAAGSGSVVHLAANSARYYKPNTAQYAAMKSALVHATKNWARDAAKCGVRVNAVLPGWIKIGRLQERLDAAASSEGRPVAEIEHDMVAAHDNLFWSPRMGRPEEYADAIVFLLSDRASYINGALLPVDGGTPVW